MKVSQIPILAALCFAVSYLLAWNAEIIRDHWHDLTLIWQEMIR